MVSARGLWLGLLLVSWVSTSTALSFNNAYIQNLKNGRCITIQKDALLDPLESSKCNCGPYQFWSMEDGEHVTNDLALYPYMDELFGYTPNGKTVGIYAFTGSNWQKWRVHEEEDDVYSFVNRQTQKCLRQGPSGTIDQWDCDDKDDNQKWKIIQNPCGKLSRIPERFQLQNPDTGLCAVVLDNSNAAWGKIGTGKCSCENDYHFWKQNKKNLVMQGLTKQCMADWEKQGYPGVTQCGCVADAIHNWRLAPFEDGTFNIINAVEAKCVAVPGTSENRQLGFENCDRTSAEQKWKFYDSCHPEPPPTPKPTQPPTPPPTTPKPTPQPTNVVPTELQYFFESGSMNWLTPTRYILLSGGKWDSVTQTWYTADGREVKPGTETWTIYFGDVKPSFLNTLFAGGKTWNETFGWMNIDFFKTWTSWNVTPTPPPQRKNEIPSNLVVYFTNGQMNWLTPERSMLLPEGQWDSVTQVWTTVDGREVRPGTEMWTIYFGNASPSLVTTLFPPGKTYKDTFGWMTMDFFKTWTSWKPSPEPQRKDEIPSQYVTHFTNGDMNWLTPGRYTMLQGGRWDSVNQVWITVDRRQIRPGTTEWGIYFGNLQPSFVTKIFSSGGGSWDSAFGWMTTDFFQHWTGWKQVDVQSREIRITISGYIPPATKTLFASGAVNWLTPDRVNLLAGGQWTGSEYITRSGQHVTPGTPIWREYFGPTDVSGVNTFFGGPGLWDFKYLWLTNAVKEVPAGYHPDSFEWNTVFINV